MTSNPGCFCGACVNVSLRKEQLVTTIGLSLGDGGKGGEDKIAGGVCGIQPFLFKQDGYLMVVQRIERCHEITGVPGKPGNGFAHDAVDLPFPAMPQEPLVAGPVLFIRTGDPVIGIDARADPFRVPG